MGDNVVMLIVISSIIALIILSVITITLIRKLKADKYKKEIQELDVEKNMIVGVPILSEISKVRDLVKTDNLKNKLDYWDNTFKEIKDDRLTKLSDLLLEADELLERRQYVPVVQKIASIEIEIAELKTKINLLLDEIKTITKSEERNRSIVTKLKIQYRELQSKYERTEKDYGEVGESLLAEFEKIDKMFQTFEDAMDNNDYVEVEKVVANLEDLINNLKNLLEELPSVILLCKIIIPKKIEDASIMYSRMVRDGYPLDYLNVEYNIKEINNKLEVIFNNLKKLQVGDSEIELKTILDYFDVLYNSFDNEKNCKNLFYENTKAFKAKLEKINKILYDIYLSLDDIKLTYDLKDEEIYKFDEINERLEKINDDFKTLLAHGKGKTFAYSKLGQELDGLNERLGNLQDDLDNQLRSITSMKDDEYRAKEQLETIQKLLKDSKLKLKDYKIPVIPNSYFIELKETQEAIREVIKELNKKPIVIKILNIRVDTARDLVFKIYNRTNDLIKTSMLTERVILYGNRYRSNYPEIDKSLEKAESLFNKGLYSQSLDISVKAIEQVENGIFEKISESVMQELK